MKKQFKIPVQWSMYGEIIVEANTIKEAIKIAKEDNNIPLPEGEYLECSWQVEEDLTLIKAMNNIK